MSVISEDISKISEDILSIDDHSAKMHFAKI